MLSRQRRLPDAAAIDIAPIAEDPKYQAALHELEQLEQRLAETEARRKRARARPMGAKPNRGWADRARDLVAGGRIDPTDPADDITATRDGEWSSTLPGPRRSAQLIRATRWRVLHSAHQMQIKKWRGFSS